MATAMGTLEESVHVYQETHSSEVLDDIVAQLDGLVLSVVHHMLRSYRGIVELDFDDLHQIGVIGVIQALNSLPEGYNLDEIRMRVVAYVKAEIRNRFRESRRHFVCKRRIIHGEESVSDEQMHRQVEVKELFNLLIEKGVITREDFYFLYHRFVDELPVRELAEHYGKTLHGIIMWEQRVLKALRHDLDVRGFANAYL